VVTNIFVCNIQQALERVCVGSQCVASDAASLSGYRIRYMANELPEAHFSASDTV
jgi:hypothetical protein